MPRYEVHVFFDRSQNEALVLRFRSYAQIRERLPKDAVLYVREIEEESDE